MQVVDRVDWGARSPKYTTRLNFSRVNKFIVHYSGASRAQSIKSIQDYSMNTKGYSDIDYNYLVKDGLVYVGRGDNAGGHTLGHNSTSYGVCVVGMDGDATDADMAALIELHQVLSARVGRQLIKTHHRGVLGASYTSCPGSELENWVDAGMPFPESGDDMFCRLGDKGDKVLAMQVMIVNTGARVGTSADPYADCDGSYGPNTSAGLSAAVGGNGDVYGPWQYAALHRKQALPGPKGDPGTFVGLTFTATGTFTGKE